jgi:hypothetical protein
MTIVVQQTGLRVNRISLQSVLGKDLGIDGDDAVELMENFSKEFQVDLSTFQHSTARIPLFCRQTTTGRNRQSAFRLHIIQMTS